METLDIGLHCIIGPRRSLPTATIKGDILVSYGPWRAIRLQGVSAIQILIGKAAVENEY